MQDIIEELKKIIQPELDKQGVELVEIIYRKEAGRDVLRLLIEKQGGVSLDDCGRVNRALGDILDNADLLQKSFILEVNSPGLDRPLVTKMDFERSIAKNIKIIAKNKKGATDTVIGELKGVDDEKVILDIKGDESHISLKDIIKAKLVIEI